MAENSNIQWCDHTFNPWIGCTKVSAGCAHCYAETLMDTRYGKVKWGKGQPRQRTSAANWKLPLKWNRAGENYLRCECGWKGFVVPEFNRCNGCDGDFGSMAPSRPRVFCSSLADWLDDEVPIEWLADLLKLIHDTPNLDWLMLTKRPENWRDRIAAAMRKMDEGIPVPTPDEQADIFGMFLNRVPPEEVKQKLRPFTRSGPSLMAGTWLEGTPINNIWLGVSCENQEMADKRIPLLAAIPAKVRFLSVEPMLGPIEFGALNRIRWVIFGGESGPGARPCNWRWIRDGVEQCHEVGQAVFVKQLGGNIIGLNTDGFEGDQYDNWPMDTNYTDLEPSVYQGAPVRIKLRDKKGGDMAEWPEALRVREFPTPEG